MIYWRQWHTNLQQYLSDNIETIQKRALRCIFRGASYAEILSNVGLQTLKDRRDCICKKYFDSMKSETHKLHHLLPDERHVNYEMRQSKLYPLPKTRTNRYRNSFIPWGLRNCQWALSRDKRLLFHSLQASIVAFTAVWRKCPMYLECTANDVSVIDLNVLS